MPQFTVQTPDVFLESFTHEAATANEQILIQTMNFDLGKDADEIAATLYEARKRNVTVRLNIDWVSNLFYNKGFDFLPFLHPKKALAIHANQKNRRALFAELRAAGMDVTITNPPNLLTNIIPLFGRNHIKMYVIDHRVAWIGGMNLMSESFQIEDLMIKTTQPALINALIAQFPQVNQLRPAHDYAVTCDEQNELLIDSGHTARSLIYERAQSIIKEAQKEVLFVSQMVPDFALLKEMVEVAQQRQVKITVITSNTSDDLFTKYPYVLTYHQFLTKTHYSPHFNLIHINKKVHIKLLIVDNQIALFGSHNFSQVGVFLGTEEICLATKNAEVIADLQRHAEALLPCAEEVVSPMAALNLNTLPNLEN